MYEVQTVDCGGTTCAKYRYEPEIQEDEPITCPLVCAQCDYYRIT